jgi:hypothetical protein
MVPALSNTSLRRQYRSDSASGSRSNTLKPSPKQLSKATAGGSIRLMPDLQCSDKGEVFPLINESAVT